MTHICISSLNFSSLSHHLNSIPPPAQATIFSPHISSLNKSYQRYLQKFIHNLTTSPHSYCYHPGPSYPPSSLGCQTCLLTNLPAPTLAAHKPGVLSKH